MARPSPKLAMLAALVLSSLGCRDAGTVASAGGVWVTEREVLFERTFIGHPTTKTIALHSGARSDRTAILAVEGPFTVERVSVEVPAGAVIDVPITYTPESAGPDTGLLQVTVEGERFSLRLSGSAEVPPDCVAAGPCTSSTFDPAAGACVSAILPDETSCVPDNACLMNGVCLAGLCVGDTLGCDDGNACTQDACDGLAGCVNTDVSDACPAPSDPCLVPACDPAIGCTAVTAVDGTACGPADCVTAHVCVAGACKVLPVPEGAACGADSPCQAKGTCRGGVCDAPAKGPTVPAWTYTPQIELDPALGFVADDANNLYWNECTAFECDGPGCGCTLVSATAGGVIRWKVPLPVSDVPRTQLVVGGHVISMVHSYGLVANRTSDGFATWKLTVEELPKPALTPGTVAPWTSLRDLSAPGNSLRLAYDVYSGTSGSSAWIVEIDPATGVPKWSRELIGEFNGLYADRLGNSYLDGTAPDLTGQGARATLWSVSPTGTVRWVTQAQATSLFAATTSHLYAWNVSTLDAQLATAAWNHAGESMISARDGLLRPLVRGPDSWWTVAGANGVEVMKVANLDGAPRWRVPLTLWGEELVHPLLTDDDTFVIATGVVGADWAVTGIDAQGNELYRCDLPPSDEGYHSAMLMEDTLVLLKDDFQSQTIVGFPVPNTRPAATGWGSLRGNPQRTNAER